MTHSDDDGLVLPPKLAPAHVVIMPVIHKDDTRQMVMEYCEQLQKELTAIMYHGAPLRVEMDARDLRGGEKVWSWIKKGAPIRLEIGPRDIENDAVFLGRRDRAPKDRCAQPRAEFLQTVTVQMDEMHNALLNRARVFRDENTRQIDSKEEFYDFFTPKNPNKPEVHGGFALCHWSGDSAVEEQVQQDLNVSIRCIPLDAPEEKGTCVISGKPSPRRVIFAKAY